MLTAAILAALGAAVAFAMAAILQQETARTVDPDNSLSPRLLLILLRRPKWLAGIALLLSGYGLQALALANGPVALVQPIVATELAFAVPIGIWRRHRRAGKREWGAILAVLAGVSVLLLVASPANGTSQPDQADWFACLLPAGAVIAVLLAIASRSTGPRRAILLGCAAGLAFALLAILTKAVTHNLAVNVGSTFTNWEVYLLIALGITALVISQSAYQAGPLALSMPAIALLEPAVAVVMGDTAFSEQAHLSGAALAVELLAGLVAAAGLFKLATSPTVVALYEQRDRPPVSTAAHRQRTPDSTPTSRQPDRAQTTRAGPVRLLGDQLVQTKAPNSDKASHGD
jgi:drug/metabolite transporter (DMT)-like permease